MEQVSNQDRIQELNWILLVRAEQEITLIFMNNIARLT